MNNKSLKNYLEERRMDWTGTHEDELKEFFETLKNKENNGKNKTFIWAKALKTEDDTVGNIQVYKAITNVTYGKLNKNFVETIGTTATFFSINSFNNEQFNRNYNYVEKDGKSFKELHRSKEYLHNVDCFALDVDFKDENNKWLSEDAPNPLSADAIIHLIRSVLEPTFIVFSGGGLHIYYNIINGDLSGYNSLALKRFENKYKTAMLMLCDMLEKVNIYPDRNALDTSRVLRIPYSLNTKRNPYVQTGIAYKNVEIAYDLNLFLRRAQQYNKKYNIVQNTPKNNIKRTTKKVVTKLTVNHNYQQTYKYNPIPSDITVPNTNYNRRGTKYTNYSIFIHSALEDINWLTQHKDYTGNREKLLYMVASLIKSHNNLINEAGNKYKQSKQIGWSQVINTTNNKTFWDQIDFEEWITKIGANMNLSQEEITNIIKQRYSINIVVKKETLFNMFGVNETDETYMKVLFMGENEKKRRSDIRTKEKNDRQHAKEKAERNKNKQQKQLEEENIIEPLMDNHSLREIRKLTGYSLGKVQTIVKRINEKRNQ